jgi:transposase
MGRTIGIRHRRKKTVEDEARPTQMTIVEDGKEKSYKLPDDQAELDFVFGQFPIAFRDVDYGMDDLATFALHHVKWNEVKKGEEVPAVPERYLKKLGKKVLVAVKVPSAYEGLALGDTVGMMLGGSGDMLAYAIVRRAEEIGAQVCRIPPFSLKAEREEDSKDDDSVPLARLVATKPQLFYGVQSRDKKVILVRELYRERMDAQKARIACELRFRQVFVGQIFTAVAPEAEIEKLFEVAKSNDPILQNMFALEKEANKKLESALENLDVYNSVFAPLEGVGPQTSARILTGIVDIRRFANRDKFVAFCGTSPNKDGKFRRKRRGEVGNWTPSVRQGLYLIISDQANKRPDSVWGKRLREVKAKLREKHPEAVVIDGKKRFTDGHIHKMAVWKTATELARYIYCEWTKLENDGRQFAEAA